MARWDSCNILQTGPVASRVWQFNKNLSVHRDQTIKPGDPLPEHIVGKSWGALFQKKLNVAWLPSEHVFIRVVQLPPSTPEETRTMVELQLEKLSPIPVTQAVWSMHALGKSAQGLQTVIVLIAERTMVEGFLGKLEEQGFLADRLELPMLDQLQAMQPDSEGAWIFPDTTGTKSSALVAWWYGGVLQSVGLITPAHDGNRAASIRDQLVQMAWAGELEGWLTSPPYWHLVAEGEAAGEWEKALREGLDAPVKNVAPLSGPELATRTAKRLAEANADVNLLPPEFAKRYRQQFLDALWGRGLLVALGIYCAAVLVVFVAIQVRAFQVGGKEKEVASLGLTYTNAMQTIARYGVLKNREALKFAALDCWEAVAENQPSGITLESLTFSDGKRIMLNGTCPASQVSDAIDFSGKLKKHLRGDGKPLFDPLAGERFSSTVNAGTALARWSFGLELKDAIAE